MSSTKTDREYATIVTEYADGQVSVSSYYHATSAVRTMIELRPISTGIVKSEGLYATDQFHAGVVREADGLFPTN